MKGIVFLFMFIFFNVFKGHCQKFYLTIDDGSLKSITITKNGLVSTNVPGCTGAKYYSIATLKNKLYYLVNGNGLSAGDLTGSPTILSNCKVVAINSNNNAVSANNLAIDNNGVAYFADGLQLFAIFPGSPALVHVGQLPYYSAGDLVFYKNELYMATEGGIVKVPLNDPSKSSFYIKIPNKTIYGLASAIVNGKNTIYAISVASKTSSQIIELDMSGKKVKGIIGTVPYYVLDAASEISDADIHIIETPNTIITQECDMFNRAHVEIVCKPHTGQYTFTLNTGEKNNTGIFDNISPGKYTLVITSTENVVSKTVNFTIKNFTIGNPVITVTEKKPNCTASGEIKLDAGAAASLYKIKYGSDIFDFDHTFTGLAPGPYYFDILNAQGCIIDQKDITLTQDDCPIIVSATNISQECDVFNKAHVEIVCSPHNSTYTFTLNSGQKNTTGIFDNLSPGSYQANITSNGFETPAVANFTVNDFTAGNPVITAAKKNPICNSKGELKLDAGAANSSYKIKYGNDVFGFDHTFTGLIAGSYHFIILNDKSCIADEKDYTLTQEPCPPVGVLNATVTQECAVFNKGHVEIACKPHTNQYTFILDNGQTNTTGIFDKLAPGKYKATITSNGDESPVDINFTVDDFTIGNPAITFVPKNPVCDLKGELKLDAGIANSSYAIKYGNDVFGFDHVFTNLVAGNYHFTILSANGCIADEKDYLLRQDACPPITISNVDIKQRCDIFNQASIQVSTADHPDTYTYTIAGISNTTGIFDAFKPGTYNLVIMSSGGDRKEQRVIVPDFGLGPNAITYSIKDAICTLPGEIKFTANAGSNGANQIQHGTDVYSFGQTIKGLAAGSNNFTILNQQGCIIDVLDIDIPQDDCNAVVFPNAFTPNGDGINDIFRPKQDSNPLNYKLYVYDRQGALIFQSLDFYNGWNGKYNGKPVPFGVYYWIANYTMPGAKTAILSGYVTLMR